MSELEPGREIERPDEAFEPYELDARIPWPLVFIAAGLGLWGALTLYDTRNHDPIATAERITADETVLNRPAEPGLALFEASCATCHQPNGAGVRGAVPPLVRSPFVENGPLLVSGILLRGIDGPIRVGSNIYDGHMPSFASTLGDAEIATLATYVSARFGGSEEGLDPDIVAEQRLAFSDAGSWGGGEEIAAFFDTALGSQPPVSQSATEPIDPVISGLIFEGRGGQWSCASCHGDLGQGRETTPRLAGLPAGYIADQLAGFQSGGRDDENMRVVAADLTPAEMRALGDYYADLRVPSNAGPELGGDLARGEELATVGDWDLTVPGCFSCHGPSGFGVAPDFPALAAQHPAYTAAQLAAWAGERRDTDPLSLMGHIGTSLDDADRRAVADYLASLPPFPAGTGNRDAQSGEVR